MQISLDKMVNDLHTGGLTPTRQVNLTKKMLLAAVEQPHSTVLINFLPFDKAYSFVQLTKEGYTGKTNKGIGIGDTAEQVTKAYGQPGSIVATTNGQCLIYGNYHLLFNIDSTGKVSQIGSYRQKAREE